MFYIWNRVAFVQIPSTYISLLNRYGNWANIICAILHNQCCFVFPLFLLFILFGFLNEEQLPAARYKLEGDQIPRQAYQVKVEVVKKDTCPPKLLHGVRCLSPSRQMIKKCTLIIFRHATSSLLVFLFMSPQGSKKHTTSTESHH